MLVFYLSLIESENEKSKFEIIYYEYRERMFSAAFDVLMNNEDAEDAVHNAFIGIANNIKHIGEPMSQRTLSYVVKAAKNAAINIYNKNNRIKTVELTDGAVIDDDDFFDKLCIEDNYNKTVKAITELKDMYRIPMYYYYVCDMKTKEIADLMKLSSSAVKMRIQRGKKELIRILGESSNDE